MDLTQFKEVNDAMGHRAGDQLLVDISARLSQQVSGHVQLLARLGGDEFALLTPPITGQDEAVALARLALEALERPFEVDGVPVQSMANIGVALCPDHGVDAADLLKMADISWANCAERRPQGNCNCITNRPSTCAPGRLRRSRRWCAGTTNTTV